MDKHLQFSGLWAVVLGGSSGFGFASVEKLAAHGMNIAVLYRETSASEKTLLPRFEAIAKKNSVTILPLNSNALDESARSSFIAKFKTHAPANSVRLLLHSIARGNLKPLVVPVGENDGYNTLSVDDIQMTTYAMSTSLLDWTRLLLVEQLFHADTRIVGLTSEGAHKYWEGYAAVSIAKSALESLAKYMAVEYASYGIKTNIIQAGFTATAALKKIPGSEKLLEIGTQRNPFGRMTKPEDVANVIYLLCTDESAWVNGSLIHVDGGEHCR